MFITKKHIPRRTFLRGCGVTVALPFLESMLPAQTPLRQTAASPGSVRRFVGIWHPHGAAPGYWSPLQEGSNFEFSFITKPLEPFRDRVVLISARPGRVKAVYRVDLARPRLVEEAMAHPRFMALFQEIWASLKQEVLASREKPQ